MIEGDVVQSLGVHTLKQRVKMMSLALDGSRGGDEEDEDDDENDEDDEEDRNVELTVQPPDPNDAASEYEQVEMTGLSFDEALTITTDWETFSLEKDDLAKVIARPRTWISALFRAFVAPYSTKPTFIDFEEISKEDFLSWQKHWAEKAKDRLSSKPDLREAFVVLLFNMVIQLHEARNALVCHGNSRRELDMNLTCSMRLRLVIATIEKLPIVRWDVSTRQRLWDLVHSPINLVKIKEANKKLNDRKKDKYKLLRKSNASLGETKKSDWIPMSNGTDNVRKLLEDCTSLADVGLDTDEDDASKLDTTGAEFGDALTGENEDEGGHAGSNEERHDKMLPDNMETSE